MRIRAAGAVEIHAESNTITGWNASGARNAANFAQYFVAVFDHPFARHGTFELPEDGQGRTTPARTAAITAGDPRAGGQSRRRLCRLRDESGRSRHRAHRRLADRHRAGPPQSRARHAGGRFRSASPRRAKSAWERQLSRIDVEGGNAAERRTFYTALYHTVQFPHMLEEIDGAGKVVHWSPYDGQVHPGEMFADTGFWDTFRAEFPLLTILEPKRDAAIIRAMLHAYDEGGFLPKWPNPGETNVMIATHGDSVIADAYAKGIRDFDAAKAYAALRKDATEKGAGAFRSAQPGSRITFGSVTFPTIAACARAWPARSNTPMTISPSRKWRRRSAATTITGCL
jgi:putative alpha-1,2-mannosidase